MTGFLFMALISRSVSSHRRAGNKTQNGSAALQTIVFPGTRQRDKRSHRRAGNKNPSAALQTIESAAGSEIGPMPPLSIACRAWMDRRSRTTRLAPIPELFGRERRRLGGDSPAFWPLVQNGGGSTRFARAPRRAKRQNLAPRPRRRRPRLSVIRCPIDRAKPIIHDDRATPLGNQLDFAALAAPLYV